MSYLINSGELSKALEALTQVLSPTGKELNEDGTVPHTDLLYYDNYSMMRQLKVSERTLQRYRKEGKIRSTIIGGKVYYPKNFLVLLEAEVENPSPTTLYCRLQRHEKAVPRSRERPRSIVIDMARVYGSICRSRRTCKVYSKEQMAEIMITHRKSRRIAWQGLALWPKKIRLSPLPFRRCRKMTYGI